MRQIGKANLINWDSNVTFWGVFAKDVKYLKDWRKLSRPNLRSCTVHVDSIKCFICPTNTHKLPYFSIDNPRVIYTKKV